MPSSVTCLLLLYICTIKQINAGDLVNSVYTLAQSAVKYAIKIEIHGKNSLQVHLLVYFCNEATIELSSNKLFQRCMIFCNPSCNYQSKSPSLVNYRTHTLNH